MSPPKPVLAAILVLAAAGTAFAQSVTVYPKYGTYQTHFVVTAGGFAECPCDPPFPSGISFSIDGEGFPATAPFSLDTLSIPVGLGDHVIRAQYTSECGDPNPCTHEYDVRDTFRIGRWPGSIWTSGG